MFNIKSPKEKYKRRAEQHGPLKNGWGTVRFQYSIDFLFITTAYMILIQASFTASDYWLYSSFMHKPFWYWFFWKIPIIKLIIIFCSSTLGILMVCFIGCLFLQQLVSVIFCLVISWVVLLFHILKKFSNETSIFATFYVHTVGVNLKDLSHFPFRNAFFKFQEKQDLGNLHWLTV